MQTFKEHQAQRQLVQENLIDLMVMLEDDFDFDEDDMINEGVLDSFASKLGLKIHRGGDGLFQQFKKAGKAVFKLFMAAIKGDTATVKAVASSLDRKDVAKFIFNLDNATLHILAIPIHTINAITGWDIEPDVALKSAKDIGSTIRKEIAKVKNLIIQYFDDKIGQKFVTLLANIENQIPTK
jgi:hypothetical protein